MRYNAADQKGVLLGERLASAIGDYAETIVFGRLAGRGIDPALLRPVVIEIEPTGPSGVTASLANILPMLLVIWEVGAVHVAVDLTAGKEERGTLELLLTAPVARLSLVVGKYLAVVCASVFSQWLSLIAFLVGVVLQTHFMYGSANFPLPLVNLLGILAGTLFMATPLAALQIALSLPRKSVREAQALQAPFGIGAILLWMLLQNYTLGNTPAYMFFIPVVNNLLLNKELLMGVLTPVHILTTFLTCALAAALALRFAARRFSEEAVLFRQ